VKLWKGKDAEPYFELVNALEYVGGVKELFDYIKKKDLISAIISASSIDCARRIQKEFGVDHLFANELVIKDGKVSGEFVWPIGAGNEKKAEIVRSLCKQLTIAPQEVIYIGDSDTDLAAFREVGLSIAFNTKSKVLRNAATHIVNSSNLGDVLQYLPE